MDLPATEEPSLPSRRYRTSRSRPAPSSFPRPRRTRASLGGLAAESPTRRLRHFRWGGAGRGGGRRSPGRSSVWVPGAAADADGGRRVAAAAPVTARVPVSGRRPAGGGWRPRPGALAPVAPGVAGRAAGCCGWSRPAPARGPARLLGRAARWVPDRVFSGSYSTGDLTVSLSYVVLDRAACSDLFVSSFACVPIPDRCCLSRIRCTCLLKDEENCLSHQVAVPLFSVVSVISVMMLGGGEDLFLCPVQ